ncbi:MAG: restriction endonuclease subunit S [Acidobacteria bacterium]|nr:restriction endonuclease subunit S [Acidobacteriota bacterium]
MCANLNEYPEYRASRVEWLGEVPAHWEVRRLGQIGIFAKGHGGSKEDEVEVGMPCVRYGDLYTTHEHFIHDSRAAIPERLTHEYTPIRFGDILFATSGETLDEIGKSAVNLMTSEARCGGDLLIFRSKRRVDAKYMGYATHCRPAAIQKARMGRGFTVMHIYANQLKRLVVALPPLAEQAAIVRFLDYVDQRIRQYIRGKEKLIARLEEQKQAAVEQAITGQIDVRTGRPYAAYKDSGVEWLPRVPAHWERYRLKTLLKGVDQRSSTGSETLLSLRRDHGIVVYADHFNRPPQAKSLVGFKLVAPGQLVVNRLQANNGLVFRSSLHGLVSPDYSVFRAKLSERLAMRYLSDLLRTARCRAHFRRESTGLGTGTAGFLRLYDDRFLATTVYLPPKGMQERILNWRGLTTAKATRRVDHAGRQIALLREYRQRIIADAVTGKLDLRDSAAALPEADSLAHDPG